MRILASSSSVRSSYLLSWVHILTISSGLQRLCQRHAALTLTETMLLWVVAGLRFIEGVDSARFLTSLHLVKFFMSCPIGIVILLMSIAASWGLFHPSERLELLKGGEGGCECWACYARY